MEDDADVPKQEKEDEKPSAPPQPEQPLQSNEAEAPEKDEKEVEKAPANERSIKNWDHSNRRIMVVNIFKYDHSKKLRKECDKWQADLKKTKNIDVVIERIRKAPQENWTVLTVQDEAMVQPLIAYINETESIVNKRGVKLKANVAARDDSNKRKGADGNDDDKNDTHRVDAKRQRREAETRQARRPVTADEIKDRITPLWRLTDEEQTKQKMREMVKKCAIKIANEIKGRFRKIKRSGGKCNEPYAWLNEKHPITVDDMRSAPHPLRNKTEFTFGYRYLFDKQQQEQKEARVENGGTDAKSNADGNAAENTDNSKKESDDIPKVPAVGFMVTGWSGGVCRPHGCANIPREACALVDLMDEFLATSPLPPYDSKSHQGFWRILTVRSSRRTRECMIIVVHTPAETGGVGDANGFAEHFETEKERLLTTLKGATLDTGEADADPLKVTSVFFQAFEGLSHPSPDHPVQHLFGKKFLLEKLGNCTFQISPGAFFQVNTEGAEILYQLVVDKLKEVSSSSSPDESVLYDVCCGTGTIGLTCMKEGVAGTVVGVDISEPAIEDAKKNAELNGFSGDEGAAGKTQFVADRAEQVMGRVMRDSKNAGKTFIAVVDPARDGLHTEVVRAIRGNERIQRLVYVSCNPTASLIQDAALLCSPPTKRYSGLPFKVTSASPVDMFRLTSHCEMVMTFDRLTADETK